jgi:cysteine-rich repeat protein
MKMVLWTMIGLASLFFASCEMGDLNADNFLNDMTIGQDNNDDEDTDAPGICGDGILQPELGENCDDGNTWWGDGCNEYCWVEYGWYCPNPGMPCYYYGNPGYCGDGMVQPDLGEQCDDGNWYDGDGCSSWCTLEYNYGDCYYEGQYYQAGDTWWIDDSNYCYCQDWNEIVCYDSSLGGCEYNGAYYNYGEIYWQEDGVACECLGIYGANCGIYIV